MPSKCDYSMQICSSLCLSLSKVEFHVKLKNESRLIASKKWLSKLRLYLRALPEWQ